MNTVYLLKYHVCPGNNNDFNNFKELTFIMYWKQGNRSKIIKTFLYFLGFADNFEIHKIWLYTFY